MTKRRWLFILLMSGLLAISTSGAGAQQDTNRRVTIILSAYGAPGTLDPAAATVLSEIEPIANLFAGLTDYDPVTAEIIPELAHAWETDASGQVWTFHLRDDVPWVAYDLRADDFEVERMVNADDVVYSVRRICANPDFGYYVVDVFAPIIAGCREALATGDSSSVQVSAPDSTTVVFQLTAPYVSFLAMTPLWTLRPAPREAIEAHGEDWAEPGTILTSGPFALAANNMDDGLILVKNPHFPEEIRGPGNIERVELLPSLGSYAYDFFLTGHLARMEISASDLDDFQEMNGSEAEVIQSPSLGVFYLGFSMDRAPVDNVHVRRAISAAIDRQAFLDQLYTGEGTPLTHFTPPGVPFGPPLETDFDLGFDPDFARQEMAAAGYRDCAGLPTIEIAGWSDAWGQFVVDSLIRELGCDPDQFTITGMYFPDLQDAIHPNNRTDRRPHLWAMGWNPDYADVHTYTGVLACGETNSFLRPCNDLDSMIVKAQSATDPALRALLYRQIEESLFGYNGEFPMIPLFQENTYIAVQPWFDGPHETDGAYTGLHYDYYTVDVGFCEISTYGYAVDMYAAPNFMAEVVGQLGANESMTGIGQTVDDDGFHWWQLENQAWVLGLEVIAGGFCNLAPDVTIPNM